MQWLQLGPGAHAQEKFFPVRVIRHRNRNRNRMPRVVVDAPSLGVFEAMLDGAFGLVGALLPMAGWLELNDL